MIIEKVILSLFANILISHIPLSLVVVPLSLENMFTLLIGLPLIVSKIIIDLAFNKEITEVTVITNIISFR